MPNPNQPDTPVAEESTGRMSFFEHLAELRTRLIHAAAAIMLGAFAGFAIAKPVLAFVARPIVYALRAANLPDKLIYTHPAGYLNLVITTGLYIGVVLASPYVLYQVWLFVAPGFYKREQKAVAAVHRSHRFTFFRRHRVCLLRDCSVLDEISRKLSG